MKGRIARVVASIAAVFFLCSFLHLPQTLAGNEQASGGDGTPVQATPIPNEPTDTPTTAPSQPTSTEVPPTEVPTATSTVTTTSGHILITFTVYTDAGQTTFSLIADGLTVSFTITLQQVNVAGVHALQAAPVSTTVSGVISGGQATIDSGALPNGAYTVALSPNLTDSSGATVATITDPPAAITANVNGATGPVSGPFSILQSQIAFLSGAAPTQAAGGGQAVTSLPNTGSQGIDRTDGAKILVTLLAVLMFLVAMITYRRADTRKQ